jgi:hypothetical protein
MGRAVKAAGGAVVDRGKALLKGLIRRGGKALSGAGKKMMASGTSASKSGLASRQAGRATRSGQMALDFEPSTKEKAGSAATSVGRAIRKVGAALQRKASKEPSKMTRSDYEQRKAERTAAAKKEVGDAFATPKEPASRLKPNVPGRKERASSGGIKSSSATVSPQKQGPSQLGLLPPKGATTRTPSGNIRADSQRTLALARAKKAGRTALEKSRQTSARKQRVMAEDFDVLFNHLVEDLINAGYTSTVEESFDLINTIDENALTEIMSEYLLD